MPSSTPFVDPETGFLNTYQIRREAEPLAKLIGLFAVIALTPLFVAFAIGGTLEFLFTLLAQFALAVGTGITLMYVIARAIALSNDESAHARGRSNTDSGRASERDAARDEPSGPSESSAEPDDSSDDGTGAASSSDSDESSP